jgi:hypothetical protein
MRELCGVVGNYCMDIDFLLTLFPFLDTVYQVCIPV